MSPSAAPAGAEAPELPLDAFDLDAGEVRARFAWARRGGHHTWLWPEVTVDAWRDSLLAMEAATRGVLLGRAAPRLDGDPGALGIAAYTSGMGPLLGWWLESGVLEASPAVAALLRLHLRHNRLRMERLGRAGAHAAARLAEAGVVPTVLKGMHTAHAYFPEPGTRPVSDVDLLVSPAELPAAEAALRQAGYEPGPVQRRPYKRDWVPAGAGRAPRSLALTHADDPFSLDVHTSLDRNFFGVATVRLDRVPTASAAAWEAAPHVRVPGQPLLALLLATHASEGFHGLTLVRLVELVRVFRRDTETGALAWDELVRAARTAGALRFAWPALELAERLAPGTVPGPTLARFAAEATPAMRRVLARSTPATAQRLDRLSLEERWMWAGTPWERARRLAHAVWPAPAGRSPAELGRIYGRRAWRLLRGRVDR